MSIEGISPPKLENLKKSIVYQQLKQKIQILWIAG